jgi:hypothetical protein
MRTYLHILLAVAAAAILCSVGASMLVDPYRVVHPLIGEMSFEPNTRVSKLEFLSANCARFDRYFAGDSRSIILSGEDIGDARGRFYNLAASADDIESIVRRLKFLIGHGCPVSAVVLGESIDVLIVEHANSLLLSESPAISGEGLLSFFGKYFFSAQALVTYARAMAHDASAHYIYHSDGHADYLWGMPDGAAFALPRCGTPALGNAGKERLFAKLAAYAEIARMADRYHFKAIVWIVPLNRWAGGLLDDPVVQDYLQRLRAIANLPVIEYDGGSPLLGDFHHWHDCGHFRRTVFDQLTAPAVAALLGRSGAALEACDGACGSKQRTVK